MREILFRGKRIDNGEWVQGYLTQNSGTTQNGKTFIDSFIQTSHYEHGELVKTDTIGQYTGLTDKNGKKIFEGDILQIYEGSEDDGYKIREVYSYRGVLCVDYETSEWDFNALAFLDSDNVFTFEVIGNIYDNPELLEDKP